MVQGMVAYLGSFDVIELCPCLWLSGISEGQVSERTTRNSKQFGFYRFSARFRIILVYLYIYCCIYIYAYSVFDKSETVQCTIKDKFLLGQDAPLMLLTDSPFAANAFFLILSWMKTHLHDLYVSAAAQMQEVYVVCELIVLSNTTCNFYCATTVMPPERCF